MILFDTTPLVALCDARDAKHAQAVKHLAALAGETFTVCEAVMTEACFHLPAQSQRRRLGLILQELRVEPYPVEYGRGFWQETLEWLAKYAEHEPDWTNACLAVLSGRDRGSKVWTYDREFRTIWRRPDGTPIPLAVTRL